MFKSFFYKAKYTPVTYVFVAAFLILPVLAGLRIADAELLTAFNKMSVWPIGIEFFIEMLIVIEVSWLAIEDFLNGTVMNALAAGNSRSNVFFGRLLAILTLLSLEFLLATIVYGFAALRNGEIATIKPDEWGMLITNLLLMWARYIMIATLCVAACFAIRKIYAMVTCIAVTFLIIFTDSAASMRNLTGLKNILKYLPLNTAKLMRDELSKGQLDIAGSLINTIPVLVIIILAIVVGRIMFDRADL